MQFVVYDYEVFAQDWLVVFKKQGEYTIIHNDVDSLQKFYDENKNNVFVGFNNKHYDDYIFKGILSGLNPKRISDFIVIKGKQGWEYPGIKRMPLITLDIKQDISKNLTLSLKEAEGYMGMDIEETEVDFDIDRPLTKDELDLTIKYCRHDVDATEQLLVHRKTDVSTRIDLLSEYKLPLDDIGKTNAKITATILEGRQSLNRNDEFYYDFPENLKLNNQLIKELYSDVLDYDKTLTTNICGVEHLFGYGGLHGAKRGEFKGKIKHSDVRSYYPSLMIEYNYGSRNIKDQLKFKQVYDLRMEYKATKNPKQLAYKLILNTTYGTMKNKYNGLYDPKQANQVCITGQLFLTDLLEKLEPYIDLLQSNTDGIIYISHNDEKVDEILNEWQERTRLVMETDEVNYLLQKDVNNYIMTIGEKDCHNIDEYIEKHIINKEKGFEIEVKGGYVRDCFGGSYARNQTTIIDKAVVNYFVFGIPVEQTVNYCNDIIPFQYICKKGTTFKRVEQDGNVLNRCNRVFAVKDDSLGKLYQVRSKDGGHNSFAGLPDHCKISNEEIGKGITIDEIDKEWYIKQAKDRINDFLKG